MTKTLVATPDPEPEPEHYDPDGAPQYITEYRNAYTAQINETFHVLANSLKFPRSTSGQQY